MQQYYFHIAWQCTLYFFRNNQGRRSISRSTIIPLPDSSCVIVFLDQITIPLQPSSTYRACGQELTSTRAPGLCSRWRTAVDHHYFRCINHSESADRDVSENQILLLFKFFLAPELNVHLCPIFSCMSSVLLLSIQLELFFFGKVRFTPSNCRKSPIFNFQLRNRTT